MQTFLVRIPYPCTVYKSGGCVFVRCKFKRQVPHMHTLRLGTSRMPIALHKAALPSSTHSGLCVDLLPGNHLDGTQLLCVRPGERHCGTAADVWCRYALMTDSCQP